MSSGSRLFCRSPVAEAFVEEVVLLSHTEKACVFLTIETLHPQTHGSLLAIKTDILCFTFRSLLSKYLFFFAYYCEEISRNAGTKPLFCAYMSPQLWRCAVVSSSRFDVLHRILSALQGQQSERVSGRSPHKPIEGILLEWGLVWGLFAAVMSCVFWLLSIADSVNFRSVCATIAFLWDQTGQALVPPHASEPWVPLNLVPVHWFFLEPLWLLQS